MEQSNASSSSSDESDLLNDDTLMRHRIEKMRNMMNLAAKKPNADPSKVQLRQEINNPTQLSTASLATATSGLQPREDERKQSMERQLEALSLEDDLDDEEEENYTIQWETGLLGLLFKANAAGAPIIRRVNKKGNAMGLHYARAGDEIVRLNGESVVGMPFETIIERLRTPVFPITLEFRPMTVADDDDDDPMGSFKQNPSNLQALPAPSNLQTPSNPPAPSDSVEEEDDEYQVIWDVGPLGCGLKQRNSLPVVKTVTGTGVSPSVAQIREGDVLAVINGHQTEDIGFKGTVEMLQRAPKPVYLTFRRNLRSTSTTISSNKSHSSSSAPSQPVPRYSSEVIRDSQLEPTIPSTSLNPLQYTVLWKDGPLSLQLKTRNDGAVMVARITGRLPREQIAVGDLFVRVAGIDVARVGLAVVSELIQSVQKPVVLVFEKPESSSVPSFRALREAQRIQEDDRSDIGSQSSHTRTDHSATSRDFDRYEAPPLPPPPPYPSNQDVAPPPFADIAAGRVMTAPVDALPPPPRYDDVFTASGRVRDLVPRPPVPSSSLPPPPSYASKFVAEHKTTEELRQMYLEAERRRNNPLASRVTSNATMFSSYSDLDDSGMMKNQLHQAAPAAQGLPELWIEWSEGPLGLTFKRTQGQIVVSRLTGHGYSRGIEQLRPGDWLVSFGEYQTTNLRLSETMALLKRLPKPVQLRFLLR